MGDVYHDCVDVNPFFPSFLAGYKENMGVNKVVLDVPDCSQQCETSAQRLNSQMMLGALLSSIVELYTFDALVGM